MSRIRVQVVLAAILPFLVSAVAIAQLSTAQLDGRVTDESAGVLPGVTVTVTQTDTGLTRTVVTNADGTYVIPALPTGPYEVQVELAGFTTYVQTGLVLQVGQAATVNVELSIGGLAETVTVEAAAPLVDVRSAGLSEVVENERILELLPYFVWKRWSGFIVYQIQSRRNSCRCYKPADHL